MEAARYRQLDTIREGMQGYVAVTDFGWYSHLMRTAGPKDANFWKPSPRTLKLELGTPFFFKLKAPHHAIAGFGYFAGFTVLPDWLAWETFGEANGVSDIDALRGRLAQIRGRAKIDADPAGRIGCCLIAEAIFFSRDNWVDAPVDWRPRTVSGAGYDLSVGEGARIWRDCSTRAKLVAPTASAEDQPRYGDPTLRRVRLGQGIFRVRVLDAYGRACAVTQEHSLPVLEAAHIRPFAVGGQHDVTNGLSLRSDLHRLFDRGYVTIDEDDRFVVSSRLRQDFENGRCYYGLSGQPIVLPREQGLRPSKAVLDYHRTRVYLG